MKKAILFILVLLASLLVATWAARFAAELNGMSDDQWGMGGFLLAMINWGVTLIACPLAFFLIAKRNDLYAASAAGVLVPPIIGFATSMILLQIL